MIASVIAERILSHDYSQYHSPTDWYVAVRFERVGIDNDGAYWRYQYEQVFDAAGQLVRVVDCGWFAPIGTTELVKDLMLPRKRWTPTEAYQPPLFDFMPLRHG